MELNQTQGYAFDAPMWLAWDRKYFEDFFTLSGTRTRDFHQRAKEPKLVSFEQDHKMSLDKLLLSPSKDFYLYLECFLMANSFESKPNLPNWIKNDPRDL